MLHLGASELLILTVAWDKTTEVQWQCVLGMPAHPFLVGIEGRQWAFNVS